MALHLSVVMITKNSGRVIRRSLESVKDIADEIVIVDNFSTDKTIDIAKGYGAKIFFRKEMDLGRLRRYGLSQAKGRWVLFLDSDEVVSPGLKKEIKLKINPSSSFSGYYIPYQNHFLGRVVKHGGEDYKMLRLFRRDRVLIKDALVHEKVEIKNGVVGQLKNKIDHYSYRSLSQMWKKFTDYALREARQKRKKGEKSSLKKIFLYPIHMFWARFIKDKGYRDGFFRLPLDLGFAYMEFLTYLLLFFFWLKKSRVNHSNTGG